MQNDQQQTILPYQQRVIDERDALGGNLQRLSAFIGGSPIYSALEEAERDRLRLQRTHMRAYLDILNERIAAFK